MSIKRIFVLVLTAMLVLSVGVTVLAAAQTSGEYAQSRATNYPAIEEERAATAAPIAPARSSNSPFFVGAVLAALMFIGVALYCKAKGNKGF